MPKKYIIGTRGSLLALTQCGQVRDKLIELTGDDFQLKIIKTQGDLITDKPLWQLEGKDFFTKELDTALLKSEIDLVVHSYKDLGSERPEGIELAAITERKYAQDILLYNKKQCLEKNKANPNQAIIIGTSSPRRIVNLEKNLKEFLPLKGQYKVETKTLRGNVNSRISKLKSQDYDGIVLALAGLERLALTAKSKVELEELLAGLDFMVLPQGIFPSAASQGSLAIECLSERQDEGELLKKLKKIHHKETASIISRERMAFGQYGGGCHLAVGIHVKKVQDHYLHIHRGEIDHKPIDEIHLESVNQSYEGDKTPQNIFIGLLPERLQHFKSQSILWGDQLVSKDPLEVKSLDCENLYITSRHCFTALEQVVDPETSKAGLWAAGNKTMKELAYKGYWVQGSSDGMGEEELYQMLDSKCLQILMKNSNSKKLDILSHTEASSQRGVVVSCYHRTLLPVAKIDPDYKKAIESIPLFFWTSYLQYRDFISVFPSIQSSYHCCGLGKTYIQFQKEGLKVRPFYSIKQFLNWASSSSKIL